MVEHSFLQSVGIFKYSTLPNGLGKLIVEIEPDISHLQRVLIPKYFNVRSQRWAPHITVIRGDAVCDHALWRAHEGQQVEFFYSNFVYNDEKFFWLRVISQRLCDVRRELGLGPRSYQSMPPDGSEYFHITIGNTKTC